MFYLFIMSAATMSLSGCNDEDEDGYRANRSVSAFINDNVESYGESDYQLEPHELSGELQKIKHDNFVDELKKWLERERKAAKKRAEKAKKEKEMQRKLEEEKRIAQEESEKKKDSETEQSGKVNEEQDNQSGWMSFSFTHYTAYCDTGCTGRTKNGTDVSNTIYSPDGLRVIAVDPSIVPLNSIVIVQYGDIEFKAVAADTGGRINGHIADILVESKSEAIELGRQQGRLKIINRGG